MKNISLLLFGLVPEQKHEEISGGDIRFLKILKNISSKKISITLIGTNNWAHKLKANSIYFKHIKINSLLKANNIIALCLFSVLNILKTLSTISIEKKSVIYSTSDLFWETIPAFYFRKKCLLWVQVIHHVYPPWQNRPGNPIINFFGFYLQKMSFLLIRKRADLIIVVNKNVKEELVKFGIPKEKIFLSSNAIDFKNSQSKLNSKYEAAFLGRLDPSKGLDDFIPIWKTVCKSLPKAKLVLMGAISTDKLKKIKEDINKNSLTKNIKVLGYVSDKKLSQVLNSSKIFVFPSHEEGWGIAIAQAMSYGLPIVCWQLKNLKTIFKNNLIYSKPFDINDFSNKIIKLLNSSKRIEFIGLSNKKYVQRFSWQKVSLNEYNNIIKKIKSIS